MGHPKPEAAALKAYEAATRVALYKDKVWSTETVRKLIPDGEVPIATRYDPLRDVIHVVCASGKIYKLGRDLMIRAELDTPPNPDAVPIPARRAREKREKCKCVEEGEEGSPDAPPCELHPNGDGKRQPKPQPKPAPKTKPVPTLQEQLEVSEARLAEYERMAGVLPLPCACNPLRCPIHKEGEFGSGCGMRATYLFKSSYRNVPEEKGVKLPPVALCEQCAHKALQVPSNMVWLDWNPDE